MDNFELEPMIYHYGNDDFIQNLVKRYNEINLENNSLKTLLKEKESSIIDLKDDIANLQDELVGARRRIDALDSDYNYNAEDVKALKKEKLEILKIADKIYYTDQERKEALDKIAWMTRWER